MNVPEPLFVLAAVLAGFYVVGSVGSAVGTIWPRSIFGALEAHDFVTKPIASSWLKAAVLASESITTVLLWIGLSTAKNNQANGLVAGGYAALLVWLIGYSFKRTDCGRPPRRRAGLFASWLVFSAFFVSAAIAIFPAASFARLITGHVFGLAAWLFAFLFALAWLVRGFFSLFRAGFFRRIGLYLFC